MPLTPPPPPPPSKRLWEFPPLFFTPAPLCSPRGGAGPPGRVGPGPRTGLPRSPGAPSGHRGRGGATPAGAGAGFRADGGGSWCRAGAGGKRGAAVQGTPRGSAGWGSDHLDSPAQGDERGKAAGNGGCVTVNHAGPTLVLTAPSRVPHRQTPPKLPQKLRAKLAGASGSRRVPLARETCIGAFLLLCATGFCRKSAALG